MEYGMSFGIGFCLGFVFALNMSRILWPEYKESIWDRKNKENQIAKDAIEDYKKRLKEKE